MMMNSGSLSVGPSQDVGISQPFRHALVNETLESQPFNFLNRRGILDYDEKSDLSKGIQGGGESDTIPMPNQFRNPFWKPEEEQIGASLGIIKRKTQPVVVPSGSIKVELDYLGKPMLINNIPLILHPDDRAGQQLQGCERVLVYPILQHITSKGMKIEGSHKIYYYSEQDAMEGFIADMQSISQDDILEV